MVFSGGAVRQRREKRAPGSRIIQQLLVLEWNWGQSVPLCWCVLFALVLGWWNDKITFVRFLVILLSSILIISVTIKRFLISCRLIARNFTPRWAKFEWIKHEKCEWFIHFSNWKQPHKSFNYVKGQIAVLGLFSFLFVHILY